MKKKNSYKRILGVLLIISMMLGIAGCNSIELTEEESKEIAEYSAGLLLKHHKGYKGSLTNARYEEQLDPVSINNDPVAIDVPSEDVEVSEDIETSGNNKGNKDSSSKDSYYEGTLSDAIGLDGFEITYSSWECTDIYPKEQPDELAFSMQAQKGMKLIVLHFNVTNTGESVALCDMLHEDIRFKLAINDSEKVTAQYTILLDDLKQYYSEIAGFGMTDAVLVFEASDSTCENIESLDLSIQKNGDKMKVKLF